MSFIYETHLHTVFASACASSKGSEYIRRYMDIGYSGIIVTDHFFNGHTSVNRKLPWKEWVNQFCKGYEEAKNEGDRFGFDVFFGWEETFDSCDDYLVFGLGKEWLLEHPECRKWTRKQQFDAVKKSGGCVVQAHPFRQRDYIRKVILSTGCVDAVEAANCGNDEDSFDALALRYAQKLRLPYTAGTDIHDARLVHPNYVYGTVFNKKLNSIDDFVKAITIGGISGIRIPQDRCDYKGNERVVLPVDIRDRNDESTGKNWKEAI